MRKPDDRPGFVVTPTWPERLGALRRTVSGWLKTGYERLQGWQYARRARVAVGVIAGLVIPMLILPPGILMRLAVFMWIAAIVSLVGMIIWWTFKGDDEGSLVATSHRHGPLVSDFTLRADILDYTEVVSYDERAHWGAGFGSVFQAGSLVGLVIMLGAVLTPWADIPALLVLLKLLAVVGGAYWLIRQEAEYLWTHYVVTDRSVHVIFRPPAIFGAEKPKSLNLAKIETRDINRPMIFRMLQLNAGHLKVDAPGQSDKRFNNLRWIKDPKRFRRLLKPGQDDME